MRSCPRRLRIGFAGGHVGVSQREAHVTDLKRRLGPIWGRGRAVRRGSRRRVFPDRHAQTTVRRRLGADDSRRMAWRWCHARMGWDVVSRRSSKRCGCERRARRGPIIAANARRGQGEPQTRWDSDLVSPLTPVSSRPSDPPRALSPRRAFLKASASLLRRFLLPSRAASP